MHLLAMDWRRFNRLPASMVGSDAPHDRPYSTTILNNNPQQSIVDNYVGQHPLLKQGRFAGFIRHSAAWDVKVVSQQFFEPFQGSFRAVSEQFQNSFRLDLEQFQGGFRAVTATAPFLYSSSK